MYLNPPNISKELLVSGNDISTIIQNQIGNIQRKNCNELNFICGHNSGKTASFLNIYTCFTLFNSWSILDKMFFSYLLMSKVQGELVIVVIFTN